MPRRFNGMAPKIADTSYVDTSAVIIGDVLLEDHVSIWPMTVIRGDVNAIRIGAGTNIQDGSILHVTSPSPSHPKGIPLRIGRDVTVGHQCLLHACTIQDEVLIGMGATVMDDVVIESQVVVAAKSLVPPGKRLESGYLYMGNPVQRKRALSEDEVDNLVKSAQHYMSLKDRYLSEKVGRFLES